MRSDARLLAPVGLHRDLLFPGDSKVRRRLANLQSVKLLHLKYQRAFMQKNTAPSQLSMAAAEGRGWKRTEGAAG